jgi:hypothetical protein
MSERFTTPEKNQPSYDEVFATYANRQQELEQQLAEIQARPGFKLDANEMIAKRREEKRLKQELAAHQEGWNGYGGVAVDRAQAEVDNLSFKSDASDMVAAKLALRDAKADFYQNYLDAQGAEAEETRKPLPELDELGEDTDFEAADDRKPLPELDELGEDTDIDRSRKPLPELDELGEDTDFEAADDRKPLPELDELGVDTDTVSPELQEVEAKLAEARAEWARISSKRQRRTFDRRIEGYNAAKGRYNELVQQRGRLLLAAQLDATENITEKNKLVVTYLAHEQNELRDLVQHESDAKWSYKFARWMNEGSRKKRLAKGIAIGLIVGTGGSLLAGAAGAGLLAGGAVAASRFVRGYTARHTEGMDRLDTEKAINDVASRTRMHDGDTVENSANLLNEYFERDSKREQVKRRWALGFGAVSVAAGATAGHLLHVGIDHVAGWTDHNNFGGHPGADHNSSPHPLDNGNGGGHGPDNGGGHGPETPAPKGHELLNAHDVYTVHPGEGWYETMQDMGIPEDKWADVLKDAGPKLHEQGWAYFDNAHGEWRISQPGHLSNAAVQTLKNASAHNGFSFR